MLYGRSGTISGRDVYEENFRIDYLLTIQHRLHRMAPRSIEFIRQELDSHSNVRIVVPA